MSWSHFMRTLAIITLMSVFLSASPSLYAQSNRDLADIENQLNVMFDSILSLPDDEHRVEAAAVFTGLMHQTLALDGSFDYPFSLLSKVSKLTSPDRTLRIFTWNIPLYSGINRFYGLIQLPSQPGETARIIELADQPGGDGPLQQEILSQNQWLGAVYFQMVPCHTVHGDLFYTLLGWRGESNLLNTKLIEILSISPSGEVHFGKKVFCEYPAEHPARIILSHSANVTISLRYEEQSIVLDKQWNARRREFTYKREMAWLIVVDRLIPSHPELEGQYEYYIPAGDVMDGFLFRDGCWNFIRDIDARNPLEK